MKLIYTLFSLALLGFLFNGFSGGAAGSNNQDRTNSPVADGTCQNCHNSGNFNPSLSILLLYGADTLTSYIPEQTYKLQIAVTATNGTPSGYGFQSVVLTSDNASAGIFGNAPAGTSVSTIQNRNYFEHSQSNAANVYEIDWTAPAAGTGNLSVFAGGNAVNGNGSTSGDNGVTGSATWSEASASSVADLDELGVQMAFYPNPVKDRLTIELDNQSTGEIELRLINIRGSLIQTRTIRSGAQREQLIVSSLRSGVYFLQLTDGKAMKTRRFVKL